MTDQEITQAREDLQQLDIEQLRCGVMLQLLKIEALTKERDALTLGIDQWRVDYHELRLERDTLAAAAKLALDLINDLEPLYWDTNKDKRRHTDAVAALREALK